MFNYANDLHLAVNDVAKRVGVVWAVFDNFEEKDGKTNCSINKNLDSHNGNTVVGNIYCHMHLSSVLTSSYLLFLYVVVVS